MKPTLSQLLRYGFIALPLSFAGLPLYLHAPDFYAVEFSLPLALIGLALLLLRSIDAVQDPFIGSFSDRFSAYRKQIIAAGAALLVLGFWMIFHPLPGAPLLWLCLSVLICTTGFSILSINVNALGGLWQVEPQHYTRIMGVREGLGLIGLLVAAITPTVLLQSYGPQLTFQIIAWLFIPLMALAMWLFRSWLRQVALSPAAASNTLLMREILHHPSTRRFFIGYLIASVATAIPATLIIFFVRDYLQAESYLGLFLIIYFLSGALAMPLWDVLARTFIALLSWWVSMLLACVVFVWAFLLQPGDIWPYAIICLLAGVTVGANLTLPAAIIAQIIGQQGHQQGAGRYYAMMAFINKAALALATGIALPLLGLWGYQPGTATSSQALPIAYAVIPCLIQIIAILYLYPLLRKN